MMRSLKRFFIVFTISVWTLVLCAQSNHSITIGDATNDFTASTEELGTESSRTCYLTWDATNLYIGITGNPIMNTSSSLYVVFDNDPVWDNDPRTGNGRSDQPTSDGGGATYPFNADAVYLFYQTTTNDASIQNPAPGDKYTVSSGSWTSSSISSGVRIRRHDTYITDLEIPWSDVGITSGNEFNIIVYVCNYFTGTHFAQWPTGNSNGNAVTFKDFYSYKRETGINPKDGIYYSFRETIAGYSIGSNYFGSIFFVPSSSQTYNCNSLIQMGRHLYIGPNATFSMGTNTADLQVDGNLCNKGTLVFSTNVSPGIIKVKGNFKNSGTITHHHVNMSFNGTGEQILYDTATFYNITLNNTGASGGLTISGDLTVLNNLTLTDGELKIKPGAGVIVNGTLSVTSGNIVIKSDATGTGSLVHNTNSISATVERYVSGGGRYHFISAPISNATIADMKESWNVYEYDETNTDADIDVGWSRVFSANSMTVGKGYATGYTSNTTNSFSGTLNNGNLTLTGVTYTSSVGTKPPGYPDAEGWNLVGNPYPSAMLRSSFVSTNTNIDGTLYFWDDPGTGSSNYNRSSDYASINNTGGTAASSGTVNTAPNDTIAVGQGFFVTRLSSGATTLSFTNSMRTTKYSNPQFFVPPVGEVQRIYLACTTDSGDYNELLIGFTGEATASHDRLYDGIKLKGNPNLAFYSEIGEKDYSIQGLPLLTSEQSIPLGFDVMDRGTMQISIKKIENFSPSPIVILEDKLKDEVIDLSSVEKYTFKSSPGIWRDRFILHILPQQPLEVINEEVTVPMNIFSSGNNLFIYADGEKMFDKKFTLDLFSLEGKVLLSKSFVFNGLIQISTTLPAGVYIVKLASKSKIFTVRKLVLTNF